MLPLLTSFVLAQAAPVQELPLKSNPESLSAQTEQRYEFAPLTAENADGATEASVRSEQKEEQAVQPENRRESLPSSDWPSISEASVSAYETSPQKPFLANATAPEIQSVISEPRPLPAALRELVYPQEVRPLTGSLDAVPVFNSNSPEVIRKSGILLSTFPAAGKKHPEAHLNYPFQGRFDIFAHHIVKTDRPRETPTFYQGILLYNSSQTKTVTVNVLQAASYLGTPDAPFIALPPITSNDSGRVFSGPGDRTSGQILRGQRQTYWPSRLELKPRQSTMLVNLPIPVPVDTNSNNDPVWSEAAQPVTEPKTNFALVTTLDSPAIEAPPAHIPSSNSRSTLARLQSSGAIYMASLALKAPKRPDGSEGIPTKEDWEQLVLTGELLEPRDIKPSPLNTDGPRFFYGRVAGVSRGSQWRSQLTDPKSSQLTIPEPGSAFSYGLSLLNRGTFGTAQIQSAPMLVRYPDTAYLAHGNYGVHYDLSMPLYNPSSEPRTVTVQFQTPLKDNQIAEGLRFLRSPSPNVFFRGTVRVSYSDDEANPRREYFHIVQTAGSLGSDLVTLTLQPKEQRVVTVDFVYPPDATPPQVLTVKSSKSSSTFRSTQRP